MIPASVIKIKTPKGYLLDGLWLGPRRAKRVIIFVHGLTSNAFNTRLAGAWIDRGTAVITFNSRGHDVMARIKRGRRRVPGGTAHEVFTECVDDITGAVRFARKAGAREIYLAGHSTGCQKSVYYTYKRKGGGAKGLILLAPVSDYAAAQRQYGTRKIARAAKAARALAGRGTKHAFLPSGLWHETLDAQRFLSLYTPASVEEIFSYAQPQKVPRVYKAVRLPMLVVWAGKDEFGSLAALKTIAWFTKWSASRKFKAVIIPGAPHGFRGNEKAIARIVREWISV